jgi:acetyl esterase/lipase
MTNLTSYPGPELAEHGIDALCFNNRFTNSPAGSDLDTVFEEFALDVAAAVQFARDQGYRNVVLTGHSAGGPTMAFYQHVAERGNAVFRDGATLSGFRGFFDPSGTDLRLPPADGVILRSITLGTAASFLTRLDGSVVDEATGEHDPALNPYDERNGFDPATGTAAYDESFLRRYFRAQAERMNRLIERGLATIAAIDEGRDRFGDDEFVVIPRTRANPCTNDLSLAHATSRPHRLEPAGGVVPITDVRPLTDEHRLNADAAGAAVHRLRALLSYRLVRADPERFDPLAITADAAGIDFASTNSSTPTNLAGIAAPVLILQGTADESNSVTLASAELLDSVGPNDRRSLVFVAGGLHSMKPVHPDYGDTRGIAVGVIREWLGAQFTPR